MVERMIAVLFFVCCPTGASIFATPAAFRMPLQSIAQVSDLQRAIDRLVATGYKLLANKSADGRFVREFILLKNAESPIYRYSETCVMHADDRPLGRYAVFSEGHLEHATTVSVDDELHRYVSAEKERDGIPPLTREGYRSVTAVSDVSSLHPEIDAVVLFHSLRHTKSYELIPSNADGTYQLIIPSGSVALHHRDDYRVYRRVTTDAQQRKVIDTLTINGWNPYLVYRHTHISATDGTLVGEVLSEGRYPAPVVNDYAVEVFSAEVQGLVEVHHGSYNFRQGDTPYLEQEDTPLTLMRDAKVWDEYHNPDLLGAGVDRWKGRIWFNDYTKGDLVLHQVSSSAIDKIGYAEGTGDLWVLFKDGGRYHSYQYLDVPLHVFNNFLAAKSKGKYYNTHVKGKYSHLKY